MAGPVTSVLIGLALGALEMFGLTARTNRFPFMAAVFVKSVIFLIHLFVVFLRQLNILLGPGKLIRYISGRYHKPRVEKRVFMFLDLMSSTALAEKLDGQTYFSFLNTFFGDISDPIIERGAKIYQYIGDEIVLTWPARAGLHDANCIRIFAEIFAEIHSKRDFYMDRYGQIPEFTIEKRLGEVELRGNAEPMSLVGLVST